jgi:ribosomal protein L40E
MSIKLQILIEKRNLKILDVEKNCYPRKTASSTHKKNAIESYTIYVCNCPTQNCEGTVRIAKPRDLDNKCRKCAIDSRQKGSYVWRLYTTDVSEAKLPTALANPNLFIREEIADAFKSDGKPYIQRRAILKCPTVGCHDTVTVKYGREKPIDAYKCRKCAHLALRKRPYERTFNSAARNVKHRHKKINWLMSYEEFASLCSIPNCHYCNINLNRAEYASEAGVNSLLLDRKDSNKDYTLDNSVPCCPKCNFTKNDRVSYDEMVLVMKHRGWWVEDKMRGS